MNGIGGRVRVGLKQFCGNFLALFVEIAICHVYVIAYFYLSSELKHATMSKWLLAHIVFTFVRILHFFVVFCRILLNYGNLLTKDEWNKANSAGGVCINNAHLGIFVTNIYFLNRYIAHDSPYANDNIARIATHIIVIKFMIEIVVLGITTIYFFCMNFAICIGCDDCWCFDLLRAHNSDQVRSEINHQSQHSSQHSSRYPYQHSSRHPSRQPSNQRLRSNATDMNIIPTVVSLIVPYAPALTTETCSICTEEFGENDQWKQLLPCNHIFHPACIDQWLLNNNTCPNCRVIVNNNPIFMV
jgi:hypothetical protein